MSNLDPNVDPNDPADLPVREGQVLEGKFRVERIVGEGAMGLIVEATHLGLDERVALKFLRREARTQPEVVARFAREARASVKIKSDHVARVFDVGTAEDGTPFIVMEFLEGSDLATILELRRRLDIPEAVEYVIQACEGLAEAHARGIVHRDIKPENLFLAQGAGALKQIKVLDFGISKAALGAGEMDLASSNTTQIMGSPHYMSPDQLRSTHDVDGRADIWSLGVVLFELLSGHMPFTATEVTGLIAQVLHEPHQRLTTLRGDIPKELEAAVDRCLAKDPAARFASAADLAMALLPFAPKRARATVERAADIARAAGGHVSHDLDSMPPPASSASLAAAAAIPASRREATDPALAAAAVAPQAAPSKPSAIIWLLAAVVLLIGIGGGLFALLSTPKGNATNGPPNGASATGAVSNGTSGSWASIPGDGRGAGEGTAGTGTAFHDGADTGAGTAAGSAPTVRPGLGAAGGGRTVRPPSPTAPQGAATPVSKPNAPKPPESDIRMER